MVADLIDENGIWKEQLIREIFKEDAYCILNIPLPKKPIKDKLVWGYDKRGHYSMKSGYYVAFNLKHSEIPSTSNNSIGWWKYFWMLNIPAKVKLFLWRAYHELIPTAWNLHRRKICGSCFCNRCLVGMEDTYHALMGCTFASKVWKSSVFNNLVKQKKPMQFSFLMDIVISSVSKTEFEKWAVIYWNIWFSRNYYNYNNVSQNPQGIVSKAENI